MSERRHTFHARLVQLLQSFGSAGEMSWTLNPGQMLREFSPLEFPGHPELDETFQEFQFRVELLTGEKFLTARERGLLLRQVEREGRVLCHICQGNPCALEDDPTGPYISGAHIARG